MKRSLSISLVVIFFLAIGQGACSRKKPINANSNLSVEGGLSAEENRNQARAYLEEAKQLYISDQDEKAVEMLQESAPGTRPWFQMDRGADINHVLLAVRALPADFTIRANWDRRLDNGKHLLGTARRSPMLGVVRAWIPQSHSKPGVARKRQARLAIRACQVTLSLQKRNGKRVGDFPIAVVHVQEPMDGAQDCLLVPAARGDGRQEHLEENQRRRLD